MEQIDHYITDEIKSIGIAGHMKPDGDCIGSTLGLYNYLKNQYPNKKITLYLEQIPNIFKFLKNSSEICSDFSEDAVYDLFWALDCGDEARLGGAVKYYETARQTICIDHHISNQNFAQMNYICPEASSTSELVFQILDQNKITKEIAECLYVGLVHDTGVFQYSCTSSKTMNIAGFLMDQGINYSEIVDKTFFEKTYEQNLILGTALLKAKRYLDNRCIASIITREDMRKCQVQPKHLEGIVAQLRSTLGVDAAIFIYETETGEHKVSLRSNGAIDVAKIAVKHHGGGHVRAAGATVQTAAEVILQELLDDMKEQM